MHFGGWASCARRAAKIRILDTHILHHYTPGAGLSEPIYLGVLLLFNFFDE
jgi:hypothetical protein